jgi:hypothetical protein
MVRLWSLPLIARRAALEALSAHADKDVRNAALEIEAMARNEKLSKDLDYVRQNSPRRRGTRLELFGGYDYYSSEGKPWWLNGRDCYRATFLAFASRGEDTIAAGLVEFDEAIDVPGHKGRYGILLASFGLRTVAWQQTEGDVVVHVTETFPEDLAFIRSSKALDAALETNATYRVEGTA